MLRQIYPVIFELLRGNVLSSIVESGQFQMFNDDESGQALVESISTVAVVRQYGRELCLLVVTGSPEPPLCNKHLFTPSSRNYL